MQIYRASVKRLGAYVGIFVLAASLACLNGPFSQTVVTLGFVAICLAIFVVLFCAKWPRFTLEEEGVRISSTWSKRFVAWNEITSIKTQGWGPFTRVALARGGNWPFIIPNWFGPSSDQIRIEISRLWNEKKRQLQQ